MKKSFTAIAAILAGAWVASDSGAASTPPQLTIAQSPLTVAIPAHAQVIFAVTNSESMDGDLSGAINTGSGGLGSSLSLLTSSSSPTCYTPVSGFTPPVGAAGTGGCTSPAVPFTVTVSSNLVDNSASRLNVAKAGIAQIISNYMGSVDFALMDYSVPSSTKYSTYVYYMSTSAAGFTFTSTVGTGSATTAGTRTVANPCYKVVTSGSSKGTDAVSNACANNSGTNSLNSYYGASAGVTTQPYMVIGASSDDPQINDVLYTSGLDPVFVAYGCPSGDYHSGSTPSCPSSTVGPYPSNQFPPNFTLAQYEAGGTNVYSLYSTTVPSGDSNARETTPTNAGYVPSSPNVMYAERGFGYGSTSQSATTSNLVLAMTTAGASPTVSSTNAAAALFTPYLAAETNSTSTTEIKATAGQSPIAGLLAGANVYYTGGSTTAFSGTYSGSTAPKDSPASNNGCSQQKYVVLITDGLPTEDLSGKFWPPLGTAAATGYGVTATFSSSTTPGTNTVTTNDQALTDALTNITALYKVGIKTYVIGLGAGVQQSVNPTAYATLQAMAIAGGTYTAASPFIAATSPSALSAGLQTILAQIIAQTQSVASAAVNSRSLKTGTDLYQASFSTADSFADWTGNLVDYSLNTSNGQPNLPALWSAQTQLDTLDGVTSTLGSGTGSNRLIATWNPAASAAVPFEWCTNSCTASSIANTTALGLDLMTSTSDTLGPSRLAYLRGNQSLQTQNGGTFRNRTHILGDIVNSEPLYVGPSAQANSTRQPMIYVGANDGMLHAFNANTGNELFAFIPNAVFQNLIQLTNPTASVAHQYFVDGSPQSGDVQDSGGNWHTVLVSSEGGGGQSIFALDITNPASITTETQLSAAALWEFTDANMGYGFSTPQIAQTNAGFAVFFGNGYNSAAGTPYLYAVNPITGATLAKINLCTATGVPSTTCSSSAANGLSTVTLVNSTGTIGSPVNLLYAGDLQGNLWRVDISNSNPSNWTVSVLFSAKDPSGAAQPITTAPAVSLNPLFPGLSGTMVFFGTGQLLGNPDLTSTQYQTMYGVLDKTSPGATAPTTPFTRSSLVQQVLSQCTTTTCGSTLEGVRTVTNNAVNLPTKAGWYLDFGDSTYPLTPAGERVVTDPQIANGGGVLVTTYAPASASGGSTCSSAGASYLYDLNFATGGAFSSPQLDINQSGTITSADTVNSQNPAGISLGTIFATAPTIILNGRVNDLELGNSGTTGLNGGGCNNITAGLCTLVMAGANMARRAWQEIR